MIIRLMLLCLFVSCVSVQEKSMVQKKYDCVIELVSKQGVEAKKASQVCKEIYHGK